MTQGERALPTLYYVDSAGYRSHQIQHLSMESAGLRQRIREGNRRSNDVLMLSVEDPDTDTSEGNFEIPTVPRYTINHALPPAKRYEHVALDFKSQATELPVLFDELVQEYLPLISVTKVRRLARMVMRKVHNQEENEELRGISRVMGVELWLLVALNVLLDMFSKRCSQVIITQPED